ncbi:MAG: acyl-CoA ligase (AMP-forming), exosortase A system-associated [Burkholderiaceae bacterium]|nr:acyl-CoA ligase (AMP-forming), exosortase A system-associated [Burkholderiaceae bacterium]
MLIRLTDLVAISALRAPDSIALREAPVSEGQNSRELTYGQLSDRIAVAAHALASGGLRRGERVVVSAEKKLESVVAMFAATSIGAVFVPLNPVLRLAQVEHILHDSGARMLIGSRAKLEQVGVDGVRCVAWDPDEDFLDWRSDEVPGNGKRAGTPIELDPAAILYTSGSTGLPKGVVLSHRNLVAGAQSVVEYLGNDSHDRLLAALPLSFDAGFSQLTTGFLAGATVVLHTYLLPQDCLRTMASERITGLTAVPPLWIQLAEREWPSEAAACLRYFASTGGAMPREVLAGLRRRAPRAAPVLMYGLTEAFRSTWLPPGEIDRRPGSIGKAIPGAEILVLRPDGTECAPDEPGELVHRGPTVTLGYWNDPARTAARFRSIPGRAAGLPIAEHAVWSGDHVKRDADGFLYFLGRRDEQIKTSGYRVSPTEIEQVLQALDGVVECVVFGEADQRLGERIVAIVYPDAGLSRGERGNVLLRLLRDRLPSYMVPSRIVFRDEAIPRGPNGKFDRQALAALYRAE